MYFHGLDAVGDQVSRVAMSQNGIDFTARPEVIARSYMHIFQLDGTAAKLRRRGRGQTDRPDVFARPFGGARESQNTFGIKDAEH